MTTPNDGGPDTKVYELVDHSDEETYWTLGIFLTLEAAMKAIDVSDPMDLGGHNEPDGCFVVAIRERSVGLGDEGKTIHTQKWVEVYDEAKDEYHWALSSRQALDKTEKA